MEGFEVQKKFELSEAQKQTERECLEIYNAFLDEVRFGDIELDTVYKRVDQLLADLAERGEEISDFYMGALVPTRRGGEIVLNKSDFKAFDTGDSLIEKYVREVLFKSE